MVPTRYQRIKDWVSAHPVRTQYGSRLHRALTQTLFVTTDPERAYGSRVSWAPMPGSPDTYRTSLLGVLNGYTGLVLQVEGPL